ncbi:hypothetical protein M8756_08300 [Lutimaribacter sp. EGI FJ00015]|nr:hypothetical protein [Lutimaribacter sp. EGI FJ00015]
MKIGPVETQAGAAAPPGTKTARFRLDTARALPRPSRPKVNAASPRALAP